MNPTEKLILESMLYNEGVLLLPREQFRKQGYTFKESLEHAGDLLYIEHAPFGGAPSHLPIESIVYHGGPPLNMEEDYIGNRVFFVSLNEDDAAKYGPVTKYRVVKAYPVTSILWDQLAANYGFDVKYDVYKDWDDFEEDFNSGKFDGKAEDSNKYKKWKRIPHGDRGQKGAEQNAHWLLSMSYKTKNIPLVIGSPQDAEFGIFPSAFDSLQLLTDKKQKIDALQTCISENCANCNKNRAINLCGGCAGIVYCRIECATAHWKKEHRIECRKIGSPSNAEKILRDGHVNGYLLTDVQKHYFKRLASDQKVRNLHLFQASCLIFSLHFKSTQVCSTCITQVVFASNLTTSQ